MERDVERISKWSRLIELYKFKAILNLKYSLSSFSFIVSRFFSILRFVLILFKIDAVSNLLLKDEVGSLPCFSKVS